MLRTCYMCFNSTADTNMRSLAPLPDNSDNANASKKGAMQWVGCETRTCNSQGDFPSSFTAKQSPAKPSRPRQAVPLHAQSMHKPLTDSVTDARNSPPHPQLCGWIPINFGGCVGLLSISVKSVNGCSAVLQYN